MPGEGVGDELLLGLQAPPLICWQGGRPILLPAGGFCFPLPVRTCPGHLRVSVCLRRGAAPQFLPRDGSAGEKVTIPPMGQLGAPPFPQRRAVTWLFSPCLGVALRTTSKGGAFYFQNALLSFSGGGAHKLFCCHLLLLSRPLPTISSFLSSGIIGRAVILLCSHSHLPVGHCSLFLILVFPPPSCAGSRPPPPAHSPEGF